MKSPTLDLTQELIKCRSVTPEDAGCQALLSKRLEKIGFNIEHLRFDDVDNLWAIYGNQGPLFCFAGHTDVVPEGDSAQWDHPPYAAEVVDGILYGRGAADMKGSIAAMIIAVESFLEENPQPGFRIAFLITSDEEGIAINGTVKVVEWLEANNTKIDWCLVGEPSSTSSVGDVIKNGRRGSLGAHLSVKGVQGHVAYPHLAENPVHSAASALAELADTTWDQGNESFPATSFQISNISAGTGATNVIPGHLEVIFNFRFSTEQTPEKLKEKTEAILKKHELKYDLQWSLSGLPFLTKVGALVDAAQSAILSVTGRSTELSTAGGTSDGRFIAPTGAQVVELGPVNASIHKVNEQVLVEDLNALSSIYQEILGQLRHKP